MQYSPETMQRCLAGALLAVCFLCFSTKAHAQDVDSSWQTVITRLKADGHYGPDVEQWFASLTTPYSTAPMGSKIKGLFRSRYAPPAPFFYFKKPKTQPTLLPYVVVPENIRKSQAYITLHKNTFAAAQQRFDVPPEVLASLLMVETRLGTYMGSEPAFWSLASMAATTDPKEMQSYLSDFTIDAERLEWLTRTMEQRSDWAYKELRALIDYCREYKHDPLVIKGSPWGALGICQFMPTNIPHYAADGNGDGIIDLFNEDDAIMSAAKFFKDHGWRPNMDRAGQVKVARSYNHSMVYANTVITLAEEISKATPANGEKNK